MKSFASYTKDALRPVIGANIREARHECKMTQADVAALFHPPMSRAAVAQWEIGDSLPDLDRIAVLARAFNVTVDSLVFGADDKSFELSPKAVVVGRLVMQMRPDQRRAVMGVMRLLLDTSRHGKRNN